jgi:putative hydrolase of the HAD superfamily
MPTIDLIALDADDTLWHTEYYYRQAQSHFVTMLAAYHVSEQAALDVLHRIEIDNLTSFGYGIRGFTLSMIEAAVEVTGGQVRGSDIQSIVDIGRGMTTHEIRLLPGVEETLESLSKNHRLMLITKGDVLDQQSKVDRSGLSGYFRWIEIIPDKTPRAYADILKQHDIPRIVLSWWAIPRVRILFPYWIWVAGRFTCVRMTWAHEAAVELPEYSRRYFEISQLTSFAT